MQTFAPVSGALLLNPRFVLQRLDPTPLLAGQPVLLDGFAVLLFQWIVVAQGQQRHPLAGIQRSFLLSESR